VCAIARVLIVKLSSIGDVVHALPVASAFKRANSSIHVAWAVDDWTAPLLRGHQAIDRVIVLPSLVKWPKHPRRWVSSLGPALTELQRDRYDVVLDLQGLARSALVSRVARATHRLAREGQREGAHLVSYGVPLPPPPVHAVDEYLSVARYAGASPDGPPIFDLPVQQEARVRVGRLLADAVGDFDEHQQAPLVVVSPSASKRRKSWPAEQWALVLDMLPRDVIVAIVGTENQRARHQAIATHGHRVVDLTGRTTLEDLVALLERASVHLAPDTGSAHIAAALGVPVVSIYGPTSPARLAPYGQASRTIARGHLCGLTCPAVCLHRRRCLRAVSPGEVAMLAREALNEARSRRAIGGGAPRGVNLNEARMRSALYSRMKL
jgi:lipopolysaccharide heptosyltransferase I